MIDIAIINGAVLPMAGRPVVNNGVVAITGNAISAVGTAQNIDVSNAKKVIDARNCAVMPGFCNSHTHIASNLLLRGLLEDVLLFEWLHWESSSSIFHLVCHLKSWFPRICTLPGNRL